MRLRKTVALLVSPSGATSISAVTAARSTFGLREHTSLERRSGSIGATVPGRYTELPRYAACSSKAPPGST
jgi:hypothetical protein